MQVSATWMTGRGCRNDTIIELQLHSMILHINLIIYTFFAKI